MQQYIIIIITSVVRCANHPLHCHRPYINCVDVLSAAGRKNQQGAALVRERQATALNLLEVTTVKLRRKLFKQLCSAIHAVYTQGAKACRTKLCFLKQMPEATTNVQWDKDLSHLLGTATHGVRKDSCL